VVAVDEASSATTQEGGATVAERLKGASEVFVRLSEVLHAAGAESVEVGWEPVREVDKPSGDDPVTWWGEVSIPGRPPFRHEVVVVTGEHERGAIEAIVGAARAAGLSIRIRYARPDDALPHIEE
jgi:hypothetical protein